MKKSKRFFAFLFLVFAVLLWTPRPAKAQQQFTVIHDTVLINSADYFDPISTVSLGWVAKYHDWFFCIFEEMDLYEIWKKKNTMLAISSDGKEIRKVEMPSCGLGPYGDFFVRNGKLIIKPYYTYRNGEGYVFDDKSWSWRKNNSTSDIIYEDDRYSIAYMDYGEWGNYTWFIKKSNKAQYLRPEHFSRIVRIDSVYYFVHPDRIDSASISDTLGKYCDYHYYRYYYSDMWAFERKMFRDNFSLLEHFAPDRPQPSVFKFQGKTDSTRWMWPRITYDTIFNQAFSIGSQLYGIVSSPQKTCVAKTKQGQLQEVFDFGCKYNFIRKYDCYRGVNIANNTCFLPFEESYFHTGIMNVEDSVIRIRHIIHNQDTLDVLGTDNFEDLLNFLLKNLNQLSLNQLDDFEKQLGGTGKYKYEPFAKGYFPDDYKESKEYIQTKYYKVVDSIQTLITTYCVRESDSMVKGVYLEWVNTNFFNSKSFRSGGWCDNAKEKSEEVAAIVTRITGIQPEQMKNYRQWTYKGLTIKLDDRCRMVIY